MEKSKPPTTFVSRKNYLLLTVLNIVGTEITDKSIKTIMMLPNLKSLYTWNSQITEEGIKLIQSRLPNTKIVY